ncbi:MAG: DMT family transporter [Solobacterium sp.]|nr:DMT family transporter [Solobacterium sp.]
MNRKSTLARLALLTTAVIWGSSLTVVKRSTDTIPPLFLLALRFSIAAAVLLICFRKRLKLIDRDHLRSGIVIGFFLFLAYCSQTIGVTTAMPGKSSFLSASYCVIVPFLCIFTEDRLPSVHNVIAALLCTCGICMAVFSQGIWLSRGDGLAVLSAFLFASHIASVSACGKGKDPVLITILQFLSAAFFSWTGAFLFESMDITALSGNALYGTLYLALACTALSLLFQNIGQKYTDPSVASLILSLESVFGVIFGVIFYREVLDLPMILGFVLIFAAILITETRPSFLNMKKTRTSALDQISDRLQ